MWCFVYECAIRNCAQMQPGFHLRMKIGLLYPPVLLFNNSRFSQIDFLAVEATLSSTSNIREFLHLFNDLVFISMAEDHYLSDITASRNWRANNLLFRPCCEIYISHRMIKVWFFLYSEIPTTYSVTSTHYYYGQAVTNTYWLSYSLFTLLTAQK